jgi:hypothetical protein
VLARDLAGPIAVQLGVCQPEVVDHADCRLRQRRRRLPGRLLRRVAVEALPLDEVEALADERSAADVEHHLDLVVLLYDLSVREGAPRLLVGPVPDRHLAARQATHGNDAILPYRMSKTRVGPTEWCEVRRAQGAI